MTVNDSSHPVLWDAARENFSKKSTSPYETDKYCSLPTRYRQIISPKSTASVHARSVCDSWASCSDTISFRHQQQQLLLPSSIDLLRLYTIPVMSCPIQVLLRPTPPADHNYIYNRQLPDRMSHLTNWNFTDRMLFCDSYWLYSLYSLSCILCVFCMYNCSPTTVLLTLWRSLLPCGYS